MSDLQKGDVKETIIKVAQNVFSRFGFKKTTMDEIAEAARKAKSSVYHYFKSKEEIFNIIVEREAKFLNSEIVRAVEKVDDPREKMRVYVLVRMKEINRLINYYSAIKDEYLEHYAFIEKIRANHDIGEVLMIKSILQDGVEKGVFAEIENIDSLAKVFVVALKGLEHEWVKAKDFSEIEKTTNNLVNYLLYGIVKR